MRYRWLAASVLAAGAVVGIAACGSNSPSTPPSTSTSAPAASSSTSGTGSTTSNTSPTGTGIKTASTSVGTVLVDAQGYVLYWYAPDTSTASKCTGTCATYWPPVIGTPSAAAGVMLSGKLGTVMRSDGKTQATYMGHPLYTFASDKSAGQVTGNDLNAAGGLWYAMTPSGAKASSSGSGSGSSSPSGGGGSGGYGY